MRILLLIDDYDNIKHNNHRLVSNAIVRAGHDLHLGSINSVAYHHGAVNAAVARVPRLLEVGDNFADKLKDQRVDEMDLVWVMNQPHPSILLDTYQLLWLLEGRCRFVNSVSSFVFVNNKSVLEAVVGVDHIPETHVASDFPTLWEQFQRDGGEWIVKPTNDGCGTDVYRLAPQDSNAKVILESMTGNTYPQYSMKNPRMIGFVGRYCVMQRYVAAASRGEKRVLIAGGDVVCSYVRTNRTGDHRSNRIHGAEQQVCELTDGERRLCNQLGRMLLGLGVTFTAIDMVYPYLFELNIINPGGMIVYERLTGKDLSDLVLERILAALDFPVAQPVAGVPVPFQQLRAGE
jgi:glutathione synthase